MDLGLEGKVALVTAGSKGIGRGIAEGLAAEGVKVAVTSRSTERAEQVAGEIGGCGYAFDSDDLDAIPGLLEAVHSDLGPIDIYVANTGGPPAGDPLSFSRAQWEAAQRSLLISPMSVIERLVPTMSERGFGRVVAIGSMAVTEPIDALQLSNAHRPGLVAAFKVLARQHAHGRDHVQPRAPGQDRDRPHDRHRRLARGGPGAGARDWSPRSGSARSRSAPRRPSSCALNRPRTSTERPFSSTAD